MRVVAMIAAFGLLLVSCAEAETEGGESRPEDAGDVGRTAQFLASCDDTCPEPMTCACGVCTIACTDDDACGQFAGNASCVAPTSESGCESDRRSCDVPCSLDNACERLGDDFVCIVGRCRREPLDAGSESDAATEDAGALAACEPRPTIAGLCVLAIEGSGEFGNEAGLPHATITAVGEALELPECFGSDNNGSVIPVAPHVGEPPLVPEGTAWWRIDDGSTVYAVGIAAPGLDALGVAAGDTVSIRHGVSWGGWDWPHGNVEVEIAGRGKVLIAVNDTSLLDIADGPAQCERPGPCGGQEWSMRITVDGEAIEVAPFESVQHGSSLLTNAGTLTHHRDYVEPDETDEYDPSCKEEPRSNYLAVRVDRL